LAAPGVFDFGACDIHRVLHDGGGGAVTIHAYSPALTGMGAYTINPDGTLERRSVSEDEELRAEPASLATAAVRGVGAEKSLSLTASSAQDAGASQLLVPDQPSPRSAPPG
jgi:hypothetical protein